LLHFVNVKRKGKKVSRQVFLSSAAREALIAYLEIRDKKPGPLFCSRAGECLARQNVHNILKQITAQANAKRRDDEQIHLSAHVLRHTLLRRAAEKKGLRYAMELSGHTSSQYMWRYVQPTDDEKEKAIEELF
jgi:integrase/recombinase XerD